MTGKLLITEQLQWPSEAPMCPTSFSAQNVIYILTFSLYLWTSHVYGASMHTKLTLIFSCQSDSCKFDYSTSQKDQRREGEMSFFPHASKCHIYLQKYLPRKIFSLVLVSETSLANNKLTSFLQIFSANPSDFAEGSWVCRIKSSSDGFEKWNWGLTFKSDEPDASFPLHWTKRKSTQAFHETSKACRCHSRYRFSLYRVEATHIQLWPSSRTTNRRDRKINLLNTLTQLWSVM